MIIIVIIFQKIKRSGKMPVYKNEQAKKNQWWFEIYLGKDENGKKIQKKKRGFKTKKEADKAMVEIENAFNTGKYFEPSMMLFKDYLSDWLNNKQDIGRQTRINYESNIRV